MDLLKGLEKDRKGLQLIAGWILLERTKRRLGETLLVTDAIEYGDPFEFLDDHMEVHFGSGKMKYEDFLIARGIYTAFWEWLCDEGV